VAEHTLTGHTHPLSGGGCGGYRSYQLCDSNAF